MMDFASSGFGRGYFQVGNSVVVMHMIEIFLLRKGVKCGSNLSSVGKILILDLQEKPKANFVHADIFRCMNPSCTRIS